MSRKSRRENAALFQGKDHWVLNRTQDEKEVRISDGPNGLRIEKADKPGFNASYPANLYPTASCIACSFDEDLLYAYGRCLAEECLSEGVDVLLGPGVNHKRSPLCGRNFEYFSEDPLVSGRLGAAYIRGLQAENVGACLKHLAANCREETRMTMDSVVDERTLHELYLRQFEIAVKEGKPWAVMPAYNRLNGVHCCENRALLDEVRSWGFKDVFISDWGGVCSPEKSLMAGLNLEMPGGGIGADEVLLEGVEKGTVSEDALNRNADRLHQWKKHFEGNQRKPYDQKKHEEFLQQAAEESAVLLKNEGILPLSQKQRVAVIGALAGHPMNQGSGSSHVNPLREDNLLSALRDEHICAAYAEGYRIGQDKPDTGLEKEALQAVKDCDAVVFIAGPFEGTESEGYDRKDLCLPACQISLIYKISRINPNLIVVLECGAPVDVSWRNEAKGILCMYFAGMASGKACVSLLYGRKNPGGHLAETWPQKEEDVPCTRYYADAVKQSVFRESIFSGYRYYCTFGIPAAFPFGTGLSYTSFSYRDYKVKYDGSMINVSFITENAGNRDGSTLVQIYASKVDSRIARSSIALIGFKKVFLKAHESRPVDLSIPAENLSYWDTYLHAWQIEDGEYEISLRENAEKEIVTGVIKAAGNKNPASSIKKEYYHFEDGKFTIAEDDYERILGHSVPAEAPAQPFTVDTMVYELSACRLGRAVNKVIGFVLHRKTFQGVNEEMVFTSPIKQILWLNDHIKWKTVRLIADYMNEHRLITLGRIIKSVQKK